MVGHGCIVCVCGDGGFFELVESRSARFVYTARVQKPCCGILECLREAMDHTSSSIPYVLALDLDESIIMTITRSVHLLEAFLDFPT